MSTSIRRIFLILSFIPFATFSNPKTAAPSDAPVLPAANRYGPFPAGITNDLLPQDGSGDCKPESLYASSDRLSGFNGLAIEYSIEGMPISIFQESPRILNGYPSASQVTVSFTFYGPYSIEGNYATWTSIKVNGKVIDEVRAPDQGGAPGWSYKAVPVVVPITDDVRENGLEVVGNVGYRRSSNTEGVEVYIRGIKCDKPVSAEPSINLPSIIPPTDNTGIPWTIVIGALAGTAALGALVIGMIRAATQRLGRPPEANETAGLILQLSSAEFRLVEGAPARLRATAWRVMGNGLPELASDAVISVQPPAPSSGVTVTPLSGQGDVFFTISRIGAGSKMPVTFQVSAATTESASPSQEVIVRTGSNFVARANGKNNFDVVFNPLEKRWSLPEIVCYFCGNDEIPIKTDFEWGVPQPPAEFSPSGYVEKEECYVHDPTTNAFTIKLKLRDDLDFNKNEVASAWLERDGIVDVTVTVQDDRGQVYTDTVRLHFRPQLRLVAFSFDQSIQEAGHHTYLDTVWEDLEFLVDGVDKMPLALCYVRTDKEIKKGEEYLAAEKNVEIVELTWEHGSFLLPPEPDSANSKPGVFCYQIGSYEYVQPSPELIQQGCHLRVKQQIAAGGLKNFNFDQPEGIVVFNPQYVLPRFWVFPGLYRGTSLAIAHVKAVPANKPLPNLPLRLDVNNLGSAWMSLDNCDIEQNTSAIDEGHLVFRIQKVKGMAVWTLRYSGLRWENLSNARFQLTCTGPQGKMGPMFSITQVIDVNENVHKMLADLFHDNGLHTELNNSYWKTGFSVLPIFCRGPVWNILQKFDTEKPYVCHYMRGKILDWLKKRREYDLNYLMVETQFQRMISMNGIEFESYEMLPAHVYAGFFLSGNKQTDCKVLDPWWEQRWDDPALMEPENLMTLNGEILNVAKFSATIGVAAMVLQQILLTLGVTLGYTATFNLLRTYLSGRNFAIALTKLGLESHGFSTYLYDYHSVVYDDGAYYKKVEWFRKAAEALSIADREKYRTPSAK
jgi:hypothetical protein